MYEKLGNKKENKKLDLENIVTKKKIIRDKTLQMRAIVGDFMMSENRNFAIPNAGFPYEIYTRQMNTLVPSNFFKKSGVARINRNGILSNRGADKLYQKYEPKAVLHQVRLPKYKKFHGPEDCVQYGIGLLTKNEDWGNTYKTEEARFKTVAGAKQDFDYRGDNTNASQDTNQVRPGEMMYITNQQYDVVVGPGLNFHGAHAVAKDGNDTIVSEAYVGQNRRKPSFKMYGPAHTFVDEHQAALAGNGNGPVVDGNVERRV